MAIRRGEVKTAASGKGAISELENLPGPFLPKGSPDCLLIVLEAFPSLIPLLLGQREDRREGSPDKAMLSGDLPSVSCF